MNCKCEILFVLESVYPIPIGWKRVRFKESDAFEKYRSYVVMELEILREIRACRLPILREICLQCALVIGDDTLIYDSLGITFETHELIDARRLGFPFHRDSIELSEYEVLCHPFGCFLGEYDVRMVDFIHSLQSGCEIHRVPDDGVIRKIRISYISDCDATGGYPESDIERCIHILFEYVC